MGGGGVVVLIPVKHFSYHDIFFEMKYTINEIYYLFHRSGEIESRHFEIVSHVKWPNFNNT